MISFLFNLLLTIVLFISILIIIVGSIYVLNVELKELLEVDLMTNIKKEVKKYIYGKGNERETVVRMSTRRKIRSKKVGQKTKRVKRNFLKRRHNAKKVSRRIRPFRKTAR